MVHEIPLVLATRNKDKIKEMARLLAQFPVQVKRLDQVGSLPPVHENGHTFKENAYKKAFETANTLGLPALADDSGLMVEALQGLPGVFSSRYTGEGATDEENNRKLLIEMKGLTNRKTFFVCSIAIAVPAGPALIYEGRVEGVILEEPRGQGGFGYDPLFYYPPLKRTFAELTTEEKNRVSHRGKALEQLKNEFGKVLIWLRQRLREEGWKIIGSLNF
jgi:XTP/dITP diphosphohydrolase